GNASEAKLRAPRTSTTASTSPSNPAAVPSNALSVRSCRTIRLLDAPNAVRTAISDWRDVARAHQAGDVGTSHEQHEPDGAEKNEQHRPAVADNDVPIRNETKVPRGVFRIRSLEPPRDRVQF